MLTVFGRDWEFRLFCIKLPAGTADFTGFSKSFNFFNLSTHSLCLRLRFTDSRWHTVIRCSGLDYSQVVINLLRTYVLPLHAAEYCCQPLLTNTHQSGNKCHEITSLLAPATQLDYHPSWCAFAVFWVQRIAFHKYHWYSSSTCSQFLNWFEQKQLCLVSASADTFYEGRNYSYGCHMVLCLERQQCTVNIQRTWWKVLAKW